MRIDPTSKITFHGIRANRQNTIDDVKKVTKNIYDIKNKTLEVYTAVDNFGNKVHKLYYLKDNIGNWIKSKLVFFSSNKRYKTIRSERKGV